jgi:hypothetical protein
VATASIASWATSWTGAPRSGSYSAFISGFMTVRYPSQVDWGE